MRRAKLCSLTAVTAIVGVVASSWSNPAAAQASKAQLLGKLAGGIFENVAGNEVSTVLTNLGVFSVFGLGSQSCAEVDAELNEIINQLQTIQADITDLKTDVATLTSTVIAQSQLVQLQGLLHDMDDAQSAIQMCAQQVGLVASAPGSDATDMQMQAFADQMVGRTAGPCDLATQFATIHSRIVTDPTLGTAESAVYTLLAQYAASNGISFDRIASHFIQYAITQREALELIQGAYSFLGEPANLMTVFSQPPTDFTNKLRDEEIALLQAADAYITGAPPPYSDLSPASFADAIVQRLAGVPIEATTFSLSILDNAMPLTPMLHPPASLAGAAAVGLTDTIMGAQYSYYDTPNQQLTAGIASCLGTPPMDGFSYVRPLSAAGGGFKMGSSCTLHLERHMNESPPSALDATWTVDGRHGPSPVGPVALRNAATSADETPAEALALGGDPNGRGSGFSEFSIVPDATDPSLVSLAIDLPGKAGTLIGSSTPHAFVAGATPAAVFKRVAAGAQYPDRYALQVGDQYLSVGSDGFAALASTVTYFDFARTPDGHVELDTTGGVLYVDWQYQQFFHGESPDDIWAGAANLAQQAGVPQWAVPQDGVMRTAPTTSLSIPLPCLNGAGMPVIGHTFLTGDSTRCSDSGLPYIEYEVTLNNDDTFNRGFDLAVGGQATGVDMVNGNPYTGMSSAGIHCYGPTDHIDTGGVNVAPNMSTMIADATGFNFTVNAQSSLTIYCQALDLVAEPAALTIADFIVQPCMGAAGGTCVGYP